MKRALLLSLILWISTIAFAVKLEDRYVMKSFDGGHIYFILPYNIAAETAKTKDLSVDVTYLTTSDSVTINLSVWSEYELNTDSIAFIEDETQIYRSDFRTFFIERDGKHWHHRYSMYAPLERFNRLYKNPNPFTLCIYAPENTLRYTNSVKMWKSEQEWMNQILHIILRNKKIYEQQK